MSGPTSHGRKAVYQALLKCGCQVTLSEAQVRTLKKRRVRLGCGVCRKMTYVRRLLDGELSRSNS